MSLPRLGYKKTEASVWGNSCMFPLSLITFSWEATCHITNTLIEAYEETHV